MRVESIRRLGERLVSYARGHGGAFPTPEQAGEVSEALWRVPSPPGGRYGYVGGRLPDEHEDASPTLLAHEPDSAGSDRLVVMTNGSVEWWSAAEIARVLRSRTL